MLSDLIRNIVLEDSLGYSNQNGVAICGDSLEVMRTLAPGSVDLILTSPPFPLVKKKEYGNKSEDQYIEWFLEFAEEFKRILKDEGSIVIDLGGAYLPGLPVRSIYQYELLVRLVKDVGFYLAQEFFHYNPARLPAPAEWVNIKRVRVKDSVNMVWWLSKSPHPKANNRNVLRPYSNSMHALLKNGYKSNKRPSGHDISDNFSKDNGGSIPPNLLELANTESNSEYIQKCKSAGLKPHPARFPYKFAEFFIKFLTVEGDIVLDPFAGSNTTGAVADSLNRQWIAVEMRNVYLQGSLFRFNSETINLHGRS